MTNVEGPMTKEIPMSQAVLVLGHSLDIGHWTLVISS